MIGENMPRRTLVVAALSVAVLAAIAVTNIGGAGAQAPGIGRWGRVVTSSRASSADPAPTAAATFTLIEEEGQFVYVDSGGRSDEGDYVVFRDRLRDPHSNALIGALSVQCLITFADSAECSGTAILFNRGKLSFAGNSPSYPRFALAITGGTGEFRGAKGEAFVTDTPGPRDRIGIHLV
jgi:hypothetical protein